MRLLIALLALGWSVSAAAAAPAPSWSGIKVGLSGGVNVEPRDRRERIAFDTNLDGRFGDTVRTAAGADAFAPGFCGGAARGSSAAGGCARDKNNVDWGFQIGVDHDFGGPLLGLVGEVGSGTGIDYVSAFSQTDSYTIRREQHYTLGLRARAGYVINGGRDLAFVTGGVARSNMIEDFRSTDQRSALTQKRINWAWGWRAGAGFDHRVQSHLTIGLLYMFTSLDDDGGTLRIAPGSAAGRDPFGLVNPAGVDARRTNRHFRSNSVSVVATARL